MASSKPFPGPLTFTRIPVRPSTPPNKHRFDNAARESPHDSGFAPSFDSRSRRTGTPSPTIEPTDSLSDMSEETAGTTPVHTGRSTPSATAERVKPAPVVLNVTHPAHSHIRTNSALTATSSSGSGDVEDWASCRSGVSPSLTRDSLPGRAASRVESRTESIRTDSRTGGASMTSSVSTETPNARSTVKRRVTTGEPIFQLPSDTISPPCPSPDQPPQQIPVRYNQWSITPRRPHTADATLQPTRTLEFSEPSPAQSTSTTAARRRQGYSRVQQEGEGLTPIARPADPENWWSYFYTSRENPQSVVYRGPGVLDPVDSPARQRPEVFNEKADRKKRGFWRRCKGCFRGDAAG